MRLICGKPAVRTASSATTSAKPHSPIAASASTGLRGSRASRYNPSHPLSVNTTADSAAMLSVWHAAGPSAATRDARMFAAPLCRPAAPGFATLAIARYLPYLRCRWL